MIYSHSSMRGLWDHPRNVTDEQARACAATGGVIGITGVGIFLGPNDASVDALVRHIDYAVDLVGPEHVGVASDYPFDHEDFNLEMMTNPELFPESYTRWGPIEFMPPEGLLRVEAALEAKGYPPDAVTAILGGNFRRVARRSGFRRNGDGPRSTTGPATVFVGWHRVPHRRRPLHGRAPLRPGSRRRAGLHAVLGVRLGAGEARRVSGPGPCTCRRGTPGASRCCRHGGWRAPVRRRR